MIRVGLEMYADAVRARSPLARDQQVFLQARTSKPHPNEQQKSWQIFVCSLNSFF